MASAAGRVTLIDVARAAGVSRTTASAALSATGRVSSETRVRVQSVAEAMGYVANPSARSLRSGRLGTIALYVPDNLAGYAFYMELAFGVAQRCRAAGIAVTLVAPDPARGLRSLIGQVDAFIVVDPVAGDPFVEAVVTSAVPVVAANRVLVGTQPAVTAVYDHQAVLVELLDHLWDQGSRSPALVGLDVPFAWVGEVDRAYRDWCAARDVEARSSPAVVGPGPEAVQLVARRLLAGPNPPDAIVGAPEGAALGVLAAALDAGRDVGEDLLVASCVDSVPLQLTAPPITAIVLEARRIGDDVAGLALALADGEDVPRTVTLDRPRLQIRASTLGRALTGAAPA